MSLSSLRKAKSEVPSPVPSLRLVGKPDGYYANEREDLVSHLPRPIGRVLDVGCGEGAVGTQLKAAGAEWVAGIELDPQAATVARSRYDEVIAAPAEEAVAELTGEFDTVLCYDLLEHLVDPAGLLATLRSVAKPSAHLHISVPNARHLSLLVDLILKGTFGYAEWGHRDVTHLRWFTRRDLVAVVEGAGWSITHLSHPTLHRGRILDRVTLGRSTEFFALQWYALAVNPAGPS